jgi:hypothetical protein
MLPHLTAKSVIGRKLRPAKKHSSPLQVRLLRISTAILVLKVTDDDSDGGGILIGPIQN